MSTLEVLYQILAEQKKTNAKLSKLDKKVSKIEIDMEKIKEDVAVILDCVPTENAKEYPRKSGSAKRSVIPMAAKP